MFRNNFPLDQVPLGTDTKADHHQFPFEEMPSPTKPGFLDNHDDFYHLDHQHHHVDHHHFSIEDGSSQDPVQVMGVQIGSNFDSFDAFPYGSSSSTNLDFDYDYNDVKPFGDHHANNIAAHHHHHQYQHHQVIIEHPQITMMDVDFHHQNAAGGGLGGCSSSSGLNSFVPMQLPAESHQPVHVHDLVGPNQDMAASLLHFQDAKPLNFVLPDELSCVTAAGGQDYYKKVGLSSNINNTYNKHTSGCSSTTSNNNIISRAPRSAKNRKKSSVVKGQWTTEEDRLLVQLVEQHGIRKWSLIAQMLPGRIGKQCRERWHNHLRPDIKKDTWSEEEDRVLIQAHTEIGNKWAEIAKRLPGRTENSIKNHWNATKRRQYSKRKCRSKYPRGSLLQDYIKSLNLDAPTRPVQLQSQLEEAKAEDTLKNIIDDNAGPIHKVPINYNDHPTREKEEDEDEDDRDEMEFCMNDRVVPTLEVVDRDFDFDDVDIFQDGCYSVEALLDGLDDKPKWN